MTDYEPSLGEIEAGAQVLIGLMPSIYSGIYALPREVARKVLIEAHRAKPAPRHITPPPFSIETLD